MTAISWPEIYQLMDENKQLKIENEQLRALVQELENTIIDCRGW